MTTQNATFSISKELQQSLRLVHGQCLTIGSPKRLLANIIYALFLQLVFAETYASCFGLRKDSSRHDVETNAVLLANNMVDHSQSLHLSSMRQHLTTVHITNGIAFTIYNLIVIINGDGAIGCQGDASSLEVQALGISLTTCSHQNSVGIQVGHVLNSGLHLKRDASLLQQLTQTLGHIAVYHGQTLLQKFDDCNLRAKAIEDRGELHADNTSTNDAKALRLLFQLEQFCAGHHARVVDVVDRGHLGATARSDDDVLSSNGFFAHTNGVSIHKFSMTTKQGDVRLRKDSLYPTPQLIHHLLLALDSLSKRSTVNIGLGRNAPTIQTGASYLVLFYNNHLQTLVGCIFRCTITTRAGTYNQQISLHH